jgi:hypothetical protein
MIRLDRRRWNANMGYVPLCFTMFLRPVDASLWPLSKFPVSSPIPKLQTAAVIAAFPYHKRPAMKYTSTTSPLFRFTVNLGRQLWSPKPLRLLLKPIPLQLPPLCLVLL